MRQTRSLQQPLALAIAAAIVFMVANTAPLMTLSVTGQDSAATIAGGAYQMWRQGYRATAGAVLFCAVLAPAGVILFMLASLLGASRPRAPAWLAGLTRWAGALRHWAMPEVLLLALLVALAKMAGLASVVPGMGIYAVGALVVLLALLSPMFPADEDSAAPRKPGSIQRTWALIVAAAICYVPANVLPVLVSNTLVSSHPDTIMSGMIYLFASGTWPLGLIVLLASVMIPLVKLTALAYLLIGVQRGSSEHSADRRRLLRLVNAIGRWSMLDVFVVAFVVALMQFQPLLSAQPGPGVPFFAAVVILTMLAAMSFDPRLIRDPVPPRQAAHV